MYKLGQEFTYLGKKVVVVEDIRDNGCNNCAFRKAPCPGDCMSECREDGKEIIYKEI